MTKEWEKKELKKWETSNKGQICKEVIVDHATRMNLLALIYLHNKDYKKYYMHVKHISNIMEKYEKLLR